jgi:PAS domain S-box-containing protein
MNKPGIKVLLATPDFALARAVRQSLRTLSSPRFWIVRGTEIQRGGPRGRSGAFDALILDLSAGPPQASTEFLRVREELVAAPVLVVVAPGQQWQGLEAVTDGAEEFLVRGEFDAGTLSRAVQTAIARKKRLLADAAQHRRTEEALAHERNLLRTLIDAMPDAIYVKDAESRFLLGNPGVARLMGASAPEELVGKRDFDFYPAPLAERYYADERAIITSGQPLINREEPAVDPSGNQHWLLTSKVPLRGSAGRVIGLVGIGRDVTEHKRIETERDQFFTLSLDMLCIAGFDGYFKQLNPAWERTLGFTREELLAKPYLEFVHPDDRDSTTAEAEKLTRGWQIVTFENRYLCKDGTYKWLLWSSCPFTEQKLVYAAARDITQRKQYESQLREANAESSRSEEALRAALADVKRSHQELKAAQLQLIQTAKLESVGTLAAGVAHEVKNPLQIILMGVDYLSKNIASTDENIPAVLSDMRAAISRADQIVRGLLEFSAAYRPDVKDENLNTIIESSLALVKFELAKAHIEVKRLLMDNLPPLKLDKTKIQQVFINVFMNAIHSMPQGGMLTIGTYIRRLTEIDYDVGDRTVGHLRVGDTVDFKVGEIAVVAEVEDTGAGIPEDKLAKIFDPFFTTKAAGKGSGLGLTVVKKIVELHGGSIDIRNRPEGGVIVTVIFKTWRTT